MSEQEAVVAGLREEVALWKRRWAVETESAYRSGYSQGYLAAYHDAQALALKGGFSRPREIVNLLEQHALGPVLDWKNAFDKAKPDLNSPPKMVRPDWFLLRHQTFARDGRACTACGSTRYLEIDHIKGVAEGGLPTLDNLRVLCRTCNRARRRPRSEGAA